MTISIDAVRQRVQSAGVQQSVDTELGRITHHYWYVNGTYYRCLRRPAAQAEWWNGSSWLPCEAVVSLKIAA